MAMLLGHACMRKITTFSVDSYIYMMVKIRHCDDFTSNIQISVVEPPSALFQVLVPLHKPADWFMFLSSITGRPTLSFSSWFGIPGNFKVLRNSLVYMCSIPFVLRRCCWPDSIVGCSLGGLQLRLQCHILGGLLKASIVLLGAVPFLYYMNLHHAWCGG